MIRTVLCCWLLTLASCFTTSLWSSSADFSESEGESNSGRKEFFFRLCLTPLTLALDMLTLPLQATLLDDDEDEC